MQFRKEAVTMDITRKVETQIMKCNLKCISLPKHCTFLNFTFGKNHVSSFLHRPYTIEQEMSQVDGTNYLIFIQMV